MRTSSWHLPLIVGGMMFAIQMRGSAGERAAASPGQARGQEPGEGPPSREARAIEEEKAIEGLILQTEQFLSAARRGLDLRNQLKNYAHQRLDATVARRRDVERDLEKAVAEEVKVLLSEHLAVLKAEEQAARKRAAAAEADSTAEAASVAKGEDELAEHQARRDAVRGPGKAEEEAVRKARARSSKSRIRAAAADEAAAIAGVEAAEAELAAARARLKAARSASDRARAKEGPAGPKVPAEIRAAAAGGEGPPRRGRG